MTKRIRLALQKKGRLGSLIPAFLKRAGFTFEIHDGQLFAPCENFPLDLIFIRHRDIIPFILQKQADLGIVGSDVYQEEEARLPILLPLGIAKSTFTLAVPQESSIKTVQDLQDKRIATTFPTILKNYATKNNLTITIVQISGSVEVAPRLDIADAIADLVGTGSTLKSNGLRSIGTILQTEAMLVSKPKLNAEENGSISKIIQRIQSVIDANHFSYVIFNLPQKALPKVHTIFPGLTGPSIIPVTSEKPMVAVHLVVAKKDLWDKLHALQEIGATGIGVLPIENLLF